jgi:hypothetical protein
MLSCEGVNSVCCTCHEQLCPEQINFGKGVFLKCVHRGSKQHGAITSLKIVHDCVPTVFRYYLAAYNTKALMPLDQTVHAVCKKHWNLFRRKWSKRGRAKHIVTLFHHRACCMCVGKLPLPRALYAIRQLSINAYSKATIKSAWARCGFEEGAPLNYHKLLEERVHELYKTTPPKSSATQV